MLGWYRRWARARARLKAEDEAEQMAVRIADRLRPGLGDPPRMWEATYREDVAPLFMDLLDIHAKDVSWPNVEKEEEPLFIDLELG